MTRTFGIVVALLLLATAQPSHAQQMPACKGVTCSGSLRTCLEHRAKGLELDCERDAARCRRTGIWPPNKYMTGAFAKGCRAKRE
jgi:hypothetical protein